MSTAGHTPNFVAEAAIYPFRCVKVGTAPFNAVQSTANPEILLGVTDGSVSQFNRSVHAQAGEVVSLQNGEFVQMTAGGTIAVGDTLIATTDGKVVADTSATEYIAQACEPASDGEVFWCKKIGAWTVSGGGPSPIGGGWPAPDSKTLWQTDFNVPWPDYSNATIKLASAEYTWNATGTYFFIPVQGSIYANHAGSLMCMQLSSGSVVNIGAVQVSGAADMPTPIASLHTGTHEFVMILREHSFSSDWKDYAGFMSSPTSGNYPDNTTIKGAFFRGQSGVNGNKWQCVLRVNNGGVVAEHTIDSGVALSNLTWVNMKIIVTEGTISSPDPTIEWFIDGTSVGVYDTNTLPAGQEFQNTDYFPTVSKRVIATSGPAGMIEVDYMHYLGNITR